jgi:hypothetical protein
MPDDFANGTRHCGQAANGSLVRASREHHVSRARSSAARQIAELLPRHWQPLDLSRTVA